IQRDATLPEVRRLGGSALRQAVKQGGGFREAPVFEIDHGAIQEQLRTLREQQQNQQPRHLRKSRPISVSSLRTYSIPSAIAGKARTVAGRICARAIGLNPSGVAAARTISPFSRRINTRLPASETLPAPNPSWLQRILPVPNSTAQKL